MMRLWTILELMQMTLCELLYTPGKVVGTGIQQIGDNPRKIDRVMLFLLALLHLNASI